MKKLLLTSFIIFAPMISYAASGSSLPVASNPMDQISQDLANMPSFKDIERSVTKTHEKIDKLTLIYSLINNTTPSDLRNVIQSTCKPYMQSVTSQDDRQKAISQLSDADKAAYNTMETALINFCGNTYVETVLGSVVQNIEEDELATAYNFYTSELGKKWIQYRTTFGYTQNDPIEKALTADERAQIRALADTPVIKMTESFFTDKLDKEDGIKLLCNTQILILDKAIVDYKHRENLSK